MNRLVERERFQKAMDMIQNDIIKMGGLVEESIGKALESLRNQDFEMAEDVFKIDDLIDELELKIEDACIKLIATQQPTARDLRKVSSAFKITTNLERMGDYAGGIAKATLTIGREPLIKPLIDIPRMAFLAQKMVKDVLDAYVREDEGLAKDIGSADDEVDSLHNQVFNELVLIMVKDPRSINQAAQLLFINRALERIADHTTNIAERVVYVVSGKRVNLN